MFYVFGINGPMDQGQAQRLSHIAAVRGVQRPRGLQSNAAGLQSTANPAQQPAAQGSAQGRSAVAAYRGVAQGPHTERQRIYTVRDVMTQGAIALVPEMPWRKAWQLLSEHKIAQAPVLNLQGAVVGLLLRADLAGMAEKVERTGPVGTVADIMLTPVPTVAADTSLRQLTHVLLETGLPGLPVTDAAGHLMGFVSRTDVLRAVVSEPPLDLWS